MLYQFIQLQQLNIKLIILAISDFLSNLQTRETASKSRLKHSHNSHKNTEYNWILQSGKWQDFHCVFFTY